MRDVNTQLANYFDATVERITVEDVIAGREICRSIETAPESGRWQKAQWRLAFGFGMTILVVGGTLGIGLLLRSGQQTVGADASAATTASTSTVGAWTLAIMIMGLMLMLTAAAMWARKRAIRSERSNEKGKTMSTTTDQPLAVLEDPTTDHRVQKLQKKNRVLTVIVIVLVVLALGLGAVAVYQAAAVDESTVLAVPDDVAALVDDWWAANNRADDSVTDLYTASGYHQSGDTKIPRDEIADHLQASTGTTHEWIGETQLIIDDGDGRYVAVRGLSNRMNGVEFNSPVVFEILTDTDGNLELAQTVWVYVH